MNHTSTRWHVGKNGSQQTAIFTQGGTEIATVPVNAIYAGLGNNVNDIASLIAAAPELLEILSHVLNHNSGAIGHLSYTLECRARAALAKARGE